jgi:molybdopterin-synthase adenylyltransferase
MSAAYPTDDVLIKFASGRLGALRARLLEDLSNESFAILLGRSSELCPNVVRVVAARFPAPWELESQSRGHIKPSKEFIYRVLSEIEDRLDVDTLIDVHTHPFSTRGVHFSGVDDADEVSFGCFLADRFAGLRYGSIVFSQSDYEARFWVADRGTVVPQSAFIRTQSPYEAIPASSEPAGDSIAPDRMHSRTEAAVGLDTLRRLMSGQGVLLAGAGGLGSVLAENLIQMGFQKLVLVDPDRVEASNLNRLVGATYADAVRGTSKVTALKRHLLRINPHLQIEALRVPIEHKRVRRYAARADWIIVTTDNHSSRAEAQRLAHDLFTPLISAGVNITVIDGEVQDYSGEVITCKNGCGFCLRCLARLDYAKIAAESHPEIAIREGLVSRGYVRGQNVIEPAVKTLNAMLAAMTADVLVNEYTRRQILDPILVYESNKQPAIYSDTHSLEVRSGGCFSCDISESWS